MERFWLQRTTLVKRMRVKLREVNDQLKRRRHEPIPVQVQWLHGVVQGHLIADRSVLVRPAAEVWYTPLLSTRSFCCGH